MSATRQIPSHKHRVLGRSSTKKGSFGRCRQFSKNRDAPQLASQVLQRTSSASPGIPLHEFFRQQTTPSGSKSNFSWLVQNSSHPDLFRFNQALPPAMAFWECRKISHVNLRWQSISFLVAQTAVA
ncbi:MAG: hypothetical protein LBG65_07270 [Puniceicoccales bacterium]|nr:hypothetical protein [Puniceicoccales bacterium]